MTALLPTRRNVIATAIALAGPPAAAEADEALRLVLSYRAALAAYDAAPERECDADCAALADRTFAPFFARLEEGCPTPTTREGAGQCLAFVLEDMERNAFNAVHRNLLEAARRYLSRETAEPLTCLMIKW